MGNIISLRPAHRVLIIDGHPLYREGLRRLLESEPDFVVCGEADTCRAGLEAACCLEPDLVILDLLLHGEYAMPLLQQLVVRKPDVRVLIVSQLEESAYAELCLRAGAQGYIMKEQPSPELLNAIRTVLGGDRYASGSASLAILKRYWHASHAEGVYGQLTAREREVFQLLGRGLGTHQIATQLRLSAKTVEAHRENIKHKLDLRDAAALLEAATAWVRSGEKWSVTEERQPGSPPPEAAP